MPVLHNTYGALPAGTSSPSLSSHYLLSSSPSSSSPSSLPWLCGAVVFLALLGLGFRRAELGSRGVSTMSTPPASQPLEKPQLRQKTPPRSHISLKTSGKKPSPEKEPTSSTSSLSWPPTALPSPGPISQSQPPQFWTPPSPTLSPLRTDSQIPSYNYNYNYNFPNDVSSSPSQTRMPAPFPIPSYPTPTSSATSGPNPQSQFQPQAPRRRSYHKSSISSTSSSGGSSTSSSGADSMGIEVNEEIIIAAEGWRRHTRVYGGGVCMACLESEQQQAQVLGQPDVSPPQAPPDEQHAQQQAQQSQSQSQQQQTTTGQGQGQGYEPEAPKEQNLDHQPGSSTPNA